VTAPKRIQLSRRKGWRMPENTVKVDRSSPWGNPWIVRLNAPPGSTTKGGYITALTPEDAVNQFLRWLCTAQGRAVAEAAERELRGKNLACWCPLDQPCHADVLLKLANK
jgi:hypothetical protein